MAGSPKKRQRRVEAAGEVYVPPTGNGSWKNFADMTAEERRAAQAKSVVSQERRREMKRLADDQAYIEIHRDYGLEILETRLDIVRSLRAKGTVARMDSAGNPTGELEFDATRLDKDERKTLMDALDVLDKRGRGGYTQRLQVEQNVNVSHEVARINAALAKGQLVPAPVAEIEAEVVDEIDDEEE